MRMPGSLGCSEAPGQKSGEEEEPEGMPFGGMCTAFLVIIINNKELLTRGCVMELRLGWGDCKPRQFGHQCEHLYS